MSTLKKNMFLSDFFLLFLSDSKLLLEDIFPSNVIIKCEEPHLEKLKYMKEHLEVLISEMERVN